jgi:hypothetical protein
MAIVGRANAIIVPLPRVPARHALGSAMLSTKLRCVPGC